MVFQILFNEFLKSYLEGC